MGRHLIQLERRQSNLAAMQAMCAQLRERRSRLDDLDVDEVLSDMEQKEQEGTKFMDVQKKDRRVKYVGPIVAAALMLVLMGGLIGVMVWAFAAEAQNAPPLWVEVLLVAIPVAVIVGVLLALYQRVKQIRGGEEDAAAQY
jgi:heme/copper-type cytochrome/quinol oxidase subunit 2